MSRDATLQNIFQSTGLRDSEAQAVARALLADHGIEETRPGRIAGEHREAALALLRTGLLRTCADPICQRSGLPAGRRRIPVPTVDCEVCLGGTNRQAAALLGLINRESNSLAQLEEPALLAAALDELGSEEIALGDLARRMRAHGVDVRAAGLRRIAERSGALAIRGERIRHRPEIDLASALRALQEAAAPAHSIPTGSAADHRATEADHEADPEGEHEEVEPDSPSEMAVAETEDLGAPVAPPIAVPTATPERAPNAELGRGDFSSLENERVGRFAAMFGALERELRRRVGADDEMRLGDLVRAAADLDPLVRSWQGVLSDAVRFRNPLMHRSVRGRPLAIPTETFLAEIALALRSLTGERRLIDLAERPTRLPATTRPEAALEALAAGRVLLVESQGGVLLVTPDSFARWAAATMRENPGRPPLFAVRDLGDLARAAAARTVRLALSELPAAAILALRTQDCDGLLLAQGETVHAVLLPAHLPRLLAAIGEDPSGPAIPIAAPPSESDDE